MMQGKLITFEGIDGVGKSTHVKFIHKLLLDSGSDVELVREPGGNEISEAIRSIVLNSDFTNMKDETELLLYLASRAQTVADNIQPLLNSGYIVLCDRFIDSTLAYQGYGRGLNIDFIKTACDFSTGGLMPDKTILFTISEAAREDRLSRRSGFDRIELADIEFKLRVAAGFEKIAASEKGRISVIDTSHKHSTTAKKVLSALRPVLDIDFDDCFLDEELCKLDSEHDHSKQNI